MDLNDMKAINILLVEDNENDVLLTRLALENSELEHTLNVVENGEDALDYLYQRGQYTEAQRPDVVLLDLNMPKIDGKAVLERAKSDPSLEQIPIIVLTSSEAERDILETYKLKANSYMAKPVNIEKFIEVISSLDDFWFTVVVASGDADEIKG